MYLVISVAINSFDKKGIGPIIVILYFYFNFI